jgi:hypothetical protein
VSTPTIQTLSPDETVVLSWAMPASVAVEFQQQTGPILAALLRNHPLTGVEDRPVDLASWDSSEFQPPFDSNHRGGEDAWHLPVITDTEADRKAVCWAVDSWSETGRRLAGVIIANPGGMHSRDIAEKANYTGGIPSAFRHVAGRLRAINRAPFWFGDPDSRGHERGQRLSARPDTDAYKVVKTIFEARYPEYLPE